MLDECIIAFGDFVRVRNIKQFRVGRDLNAAQHLDSVTVLGCKLTDLFDIGGLSFTDSVAVVGNTEKPHAVFDGRGNDLFRPIDSAGGKQRMRVQISDLSLTFLFDHPHRRNIGTVAANLENDRCFGKRSGTPTPEEGSKRNQFAVHLGKRRMVGKAVFGAKHLMNMIADGKAAGFGIPCAERIFFVKRRIIPGVSDI